MTDTRTTGTPAAPTPTSASAAAPSGESSAPLDAIIAGGGPAGMFLGLLLARQGLRVAVLEKHADFLRDFRGDTVHPSTLALFDELGWLDEFLRLPHTLMPAVTARIDGERLTIARFDRLPVPVPAVAFMPQWDLLDFLARKGAELPGLEVRLSTEVDALLRRADGRVVGVRAQGPDGPIELRAKLVVGADGRTSTVRDAARLPLAASTVSVDFFWFRVPGAAGGLPLLSAGEALVVSIDRGDYVQGGCVLPAGEADAVKARGIEAWRGAIERTVPELRGRLDALTWDDVFLLRVRVDRLRRWFGDGVLCIGDAAHAMSPAGGVGINLAVQDAVATANLLGPVLRRGAPTRAALARVQRRREWPARAVQTVQLASMRPLRRIVDGGGVTAPPAVLRMVDRVPLVGHLLGRAVGLGLRPEHVAPRVDDAGSTPTGRRDAG